MFDRIASIALPLGVLGAALSDTVGGLCARAAVSVPLYWLGALDAGTVESFAVHFHF